VPMWFVAIILARDIIILLAGVWAGRKFKVVLPSNYYGKSAVLTISLTLFLIVLHVTSDLITLLEAASVVLMAVSLVVYGARLFKLIREFDRTSSPAYK
jgi:phosphatidylglycerophosphate synthase